MKKIIFQLAFLLFFTASNAQESANFGAPKFSPEDGKKLLIIGQDLGSVGGLNSYTNGYVDKVTCHIPAGVTTYTSIESLGGLRTLANWGAGDVWAQAYLNDNTFDQSFIVIGLYLVGGLEAINNGEEDTNIKSLASWVKAQERPVFIRIGYEFEGPWNNYSPSAFKEAWRYIVHVFDDEEVKNAAYVWQSAGLNYNNISNWYPGDEYVNWVGYSQFDGQNMGQSIKQFAIQRNKPIMIAEAAPKVDLSSGNGSTYWNNWYAPLFTEIYDNDRIKALAYINADWDNQPMWTGQGWGDSRVQIDPLIKENWETEIKKAPWLHASESLFEELDYSNWISTHTSEVSADNLAELLVVQQEGQIQIQRKNQEVIDGLSIVDFSGRLLYVDRSSQHHYEVPLSKIKAPSIIILVNVNGKKVLKKMLLHP